MPIQFLLSLFFLLFCVASPAQQGSSSVESVTSKSEESVSENSTQDASSENSDESSESEEPQKPSESVAFQPLQQSPSWFSSELRINKSRTRNPFWFPFASFILPGFDQFFEQQSKAGFTYAGTAFLGAQIAAGAASEIEAESSDEDDFEGAGDFDRSDDRQKRLIFGLSLYQFMGSMSAYHSFRTAARSYHENGSDRFSFLKDTIEEDSGDLMLAPFELGYFLEPTSWAPLLLVGGLVAYDFSQPGNQRGQVTASEGLFLTNISYHAGVGEEALFRGWIFPYLYESMDSYFWANTLQAAFFAYLHVTPSYQVPVYQFAFGYYAGYLAKRNNWSLKEAAFVHTWWDVIAFTALFLNEETRDQASLQVPLLNMTF
ncbi:MAG: CPBP family intramembrane glutamic endopeptidase [Pseudomonadota bacterium]